jgi:hypothetical protein
MKSFAEYITEGKPQWTASAWRRILGIGAQIGGVREVPLTSKLVNKIWGTPIRATVFHVTDSTGASFVMKNQGKKGLAVSVMPHPPSTKLAKRGIWKGGVVMKLQANILMGGQGDIMSVPDESGRRWVASGEIESLLPYDMRMDFHQEMREAQLISSKHLAAIMLPVLEKMKSSGKYIGCTPTSIDCTVDYHIKTIKTLLRDTQFNNGGDTVSSWKKIFLDTEVAIEPPKKELGEYVTAHIDRVNAIMEKYFLHARKDIEDLAALTRERHESLGYSELVANEYKVLGVAWYIDSEGNFFSDRANLESLQNEVEAVGLPFWNFGEYIEKSRLAPDATLKYAPGYTDYIKK